MIVWVRTMSARADMPHPCITSRVHAVYVPVRPTEQTRYLTVCGQRLRAATKEHALCHYDAPCASCVRAGATWIGEVAQMEVETP
jgi:hypothetical protein